MNAPNPSASDPAPVVCASHLEALYPTVRAKEAIAIAVSIDAALGDIPRRWQTESLDDRGCHSIPLLVDKVAVGHLIQCIKASYIEGVARDNRPRHIAFVLHTVSGLVWIDYACVLGEANTQPDTAATTTTATDSASASNKESPAKESHPVDVATPAADSTAAEAVSTPSPDEQQTPAEIVGLYPHLTAAQAAKVLLIESALGDVPHYWAEKAPDGRRFSTTKPEGAIGAQALVKRVRFIATHYGNKATRLALIVGEDPSGLTIVVPRPPSSPKKQTIDDLLDLYPMLTVREAVRLVKVVSDLSWVPTEWVAEGSGHTYDNNGVFADVEKMFAHVRMAYLKAGPSKCHVVLSLHRVADGSNDLFYYFVVLPTV